MPNDARRIDVANARRAVLELSLLLQSDILGPESSVSGIVPINVEGRAGCKRDGRSFCEERGEKVMEVGVGRWVREGGGQLIHQIRGGESCSKR